MAKAVKGRVINARRCCCCYGTEAVNPSKPRKKLRSKKNKKGVDRFGVEIIKRAPQVDEEWCKSCKANTEFIDIKALEVSVSGDKMLLEEGPQLINGLLRLQNQGHDVKELLEEFS